MASKVLHIGPFRGTYEPDYWIDFYANGNPRKRVTGVNLRSVIAIQTHKTLQDLAGTFTITLKDGRAQKRIHEMDVVRIRLKGAGGGPGTVFKGVVDEVRQGGSGDTYAGREDTVITGRCLAKYLLVNSLFLPVFDPSGLLPTALTFGMGDYTNKLGGNIVNASTPRAIFGYLVRRFVFGQKVRGLSAANFNGTPSARHWIDWKQRFSHIGFHVPFLQFDEETVAAALKRLEVLGYTEAWVDEVGNVVYRQPQWDAPVRYYLDTTWMKSWNFSRSDAQVATYVEVIPAGAVGLGLDAGAAQALAAGRAPLTSVYADSMREQNVSVDPSVVVEVDSDGRVTAEGRRNYWWKKQRRLGLRPQQISSPLIFSPQQAQAQAEGLLRFFSRFTKTAQITVPGTPELRLGHTIRVKGEVTEVADEDGRRGELHIDRTYYIEGVGHEYVDGSHYDTTLELTHGRDPWDEKWGQMVLPRFDPATLALDGGVLDGGSGVAGGGASAAYQLAQRFTGGYLYGGGHGADLSTLRVGHGLDCSSSTSLLLYRAGLWDSRKTARVSGEFNTWGRAGRGRHLTVWFNKGHVYVEFHGLGAYRRFDTSPHGDGGPGPRARRTERSSAGFEARHWPGT